MFFPLFFSFPYLASEAIAAHEIGHAVLDARGLACCGVSAPWGMQAFSRRD